MRPLPDQWKDGILQPEAAKEIVLKASEPEHGIRRHGFKTMWKSYRLQ